MPRFRRSLWMLLGPVALTLGAVGSPQEPAPETVPALIQDNPAELVGRLKVRIPELIAQAHIPGMSIALIRDGKVVWSQGFGVASAATRPAVTAETIFEAASFTKPLFAYVALRLVDRGILDLDKPLVGYLPREIVEKEILDHPLDLPGFHRDWFEEITARHVLSHSSGMPHGERGKPFPLFFEPGAQYRYSADGYYFLQLVAEHLTKKPLERLAEEEALGPLGMTHSSLVWKAEYDKASARGHDAAGTPVDYRKRNRAHAAATLYTTAAEYARFVVAVMQGRGLKEATWNEMLAPQIAVKPHNDWGLGFGLQRDGNGVAFWQWGDYVVFRNFVIAYPAARIGVVYLTNSYNGLSIANDVVAATIGGKAYSLDWLGYPKWDSPVQQFTFRILEEGAGAAFPRLAELRRQDPEAFNESDVNTLGYVLLNAGRVDDAIALLELNVNEHPDSANTYDSLAEATLKRDKKGDRERAIELYRKVLETIPNDHNPDKDFLKRLGDNAQQQLSKLANPH